MIKMENRQNRSVVRQVVGGPEGLGRLVALSNQLTTWHELDFSRVSSSDFHKYSNRSTNIDLARQTTFVFHTN